MKRDELLTSPNPFTSQINSKQNKPSVTPLIFKNHNGLIYSLEQLTNKIAGFDLDSTLQSVPMVLLSKA